MSFELGGKSPLLVFDDADLDLAVDLAVEQFDNSGQVCLAAVRMLVQDGVYDEFRARFLERAAQVHAGRHPRRGHRHRSAREQDALRARRRLRAARDRRRGAGDPRRRPEPRAQRRPPAASTTGPRCSRVSIPPMEITCQEVFGPVLTLQRFCTEEEASRWPTTPTTASPPRSSPAARSAPSGCRRGCAPARCGSTASSSATSPHRSAAAGSSGIGREGGIWSFDFYCDVKNTVFSPKGWN